MVCHSNLVTFSKVSRKPINCDGVSKSSIVSFEHSNFAMCSKMIKLEIAIIDT